MLNLRFQNACGPKPHVKLEFHKMHVDPLLLQSMRPCVRVGHAILCPSIEACSAPGQTLRVEAHKLGWHPWSLVPGPCSLLPAPCSPLPPPSSLLPAPCSLLPAPCSLLLAPCSLLPAPCSLLAANHQLLYCNCVTAVTDISSATPSAMATNSNSYALRPLCCQIALKTRLIKSCFS